LRTSETIDKLSAAFAAAQAKLKNATFDKINPHFKSKYATLAGVRDNVVPVLSEFGLSVIQGAAIYDGANVITTRLMHSSGQWIESAYPFAIDKPQQMGSAMTYARRYSLAAICGIASEEDDDANAAQISTTDVAKSSRPQLLTVTGETAAPKAQSREPYDKISKGIKTIQDTGTIEDLRAWYKSHLKTIEGFDASWNEMIMEEFSTARETLNAKGAA
jgi:hypothetical protein